MIHKDLASGRWFQLSLCEQMANVGMEVERTIEWKEKGNNPYSSEAFERAIELLYLTIQDPKHARRRRELLRVKETLCDFFMGPNEYGSTNESWQDYFYAFCYAATMQRREKRFPPT